MPTFTGTENGETIDGSNDADEIFGLGGNDTLNGLGDDDFLDGGDGNDIIDGGLGADVLWGRDGNDTFYVDNRADEVGGEGYNGGWDRIFTTVDFRITSSEVEVLAVLDPLSTYAISLYGSGDGVYLYGNDGPNIINPNPDNRTPLGDHMVGYGGDDVYFIDRDDDRIVEAAGGGIDTAFTTTSYYFRNSLDTHVEHLVVLDPRSTNELFLFGNDIDNEITGNDGGNQIRGGGGVDRLMGLGGNDSYYLTAGIDEHDVIIEFANGGYDVVEVSFSYRLSDNVEELRGSHSASDAFYITLTGSLDNNTIRGSDGMEILDGGAGADTLIGGKGNDAYFVDNVGDVVTELAGGGSDAIFVSIDYVLPESYAHIENLIAYGGDLNLTGNSLANRISGNDGANVLDGKLGLDTLIGYGGVDVFAFTTVVDGHNADLFLGFEVGVDKIALDDAVFAGLVPGALDPDAFTIGRFASDAEDRILYEASTGHLFFDRDGTGPAEAQYFAAMSDGLNLTASDFIVI